MSDQRLPCVSSRLVASQFGRLDLLVNNAAVFDSAALEQISLEQWDAVFETNTRGPFLVAREALIIYALFKAESSTLVRWVESVPGPDTLTTAPRRPPCTC